MANSRAISSNDSYSCQDDPNFAIICSFVEHFGEMIGISHILFDELQEMIESTDKVADPLIRLHIKPLAKYFSMVVSPLLWESWMIKFANSYGYYDEANELHLMRYQNVKVATKLKLLKTLLEAQFDCNRRFKVQVNAMLGENIRQRPLGRDKNGQLYWSQVDSAANLRVYRENLEAQDWKEVLTGKEKIGNLVEKLKSGQMR